MSEGIDDVQFIRDVVSAVEEDYCLDEARIHGTGFSQGGMMAHRLACEASDLMASIAPVSGMVAVECAPERAVPVHSTHGTEDPEIPYFLSVRDARRWAQLNGCSPRQTVYYAEGAVSCAQYARCDSGQAVELCSVEGLEHEWLESDAFSTSEANVRFFLQHPM